MSSEPQSEVNSFAYVAVGVAAIGCLLFGYDTGVIFGAIPFIKAQFLLSSTMEEIVVNVVLVGAVIGAVIGGGAAMSAVTVTNWAMNLAVAVTFLTLVAVLGHAGIFWLYGVIALGAWVFIYFFGAGNQRQSLEQIETHWQTGKSLREL